MSTFTLLTIGSSHFVVRKTEDAAKVLTILTAAMPVEEDYHTAGERRVSIRPVEGHSWNHKVTLETRHVSELQTEPQPKRVPKTLRLEGGAM